MRNLTKPDVPEVTRRSFIHTAGRGLIAGIALYATSSILGPSMASSQGPETRKIAGQDVRVVELETGLEKLDKNSEKYRMSESFPEEATKYYYTNGIIVEKQTTVVFGYKAKEKEEKNIGADVLIHKSGKKVGANLIDFDKMVTEETGKEIKRMKIFVEVGETKGEKFVNVIMLPINDKGKSASYLGDGEHLAYGLMQYKDFVKGNIIVIRDPEHKIEIASR